MKPVYVINGFLESGKTEFLLYTLDQPYFAIKGGTLLILCEEGEKEYSEKILKSTGTTLVKLDDIAEFTKEHLEELDKKYKPERIIIEWNGMWDFRQFVMAKGWRMEQQITTICAETFSVFFTNMRSLLAEQIRNSELIIFNRCDPNTMDLNKYKRNIKAVNQRADSARPLCPRRLNDNAAACAQHLSEQQPRIWSQDERVGARTRDEDKILQGPDSGALSQQSLFW